MGGKKHFLVFTITSFIIAVMGFTAESQARVTGECANCHTMHNSQDGQLINTGGPYDTLLVDNCVGCHSSNTSSTIYKIGSATVPVVNYTGGTPTEYLAGGNFWWVATSGGNTDTKGHNVLGISGPDSNLSDGAPGNAFGCTGSCHISLAIEQSVVPELGSGCEGCHLAPTHHANDEGPVVDDNPPGEGWYRFLSGHYSGDGYGVSGIEDNDWQATKGSGDHNEYMGFADVHNESAAFYNLNNVVTAFCGGCHGNFHEENASSPGASPWIRHPSDAVLPASGEYAGYTLYDPQVPVARPDLTGWTGPRETVTPGIDMVMCLSCHRPHGSPNDDLLRWDYAGMIAGGGSNESGCFVCHTAKDTGG